MIEDVESERTAAARLTLALGVEVKRGQIRWWRRKGYDLRDIEKLKHSLRMQERNPLRPARGATTAAVPQPRADLPPLDPTCSLGEAIDRIQELLLAAPDYETARTYKVQLEGLKAAFAIHREQSFYVTRASQEAAGIRAGQVIKQLILKIPAELPQMLLGLDYPEALQRCEDYAHAILNAMSSAETYE
jgi:hypothetical protein